MIIKEIIIFTKDSFISDAIENTIRKEKRGTSSTSLHKHTMKKCKFCGAEIEEGVYYCSACKHRLPQNNKSKKKKKAATSLAGKAVLITPVSEAGAMFSEPSDMTILSKDKPTKAENVSENPPTQSSIPYKEKEADNPNMTHSGKNVFSSAWETVSSSQEDNTIDVDPAGDTGFSTTTFKAEQDRNVDTEDTTDGQDTRVMQSEFESVDDAVQSEADATVPETPDLEAYDNSAVQEKGEQIPPETSDLLSGNVQYDYEMANTDGTEDAFTRNEDDVQAPQESSVRAVQEAVTYESDAAKETQNSSQTEEMHFSDTSEAADIEEAVTVSHVLKAQSDKFEGETSAKDEQVPVREEENEDVQDTGAQDSDIVMPEDVSEQEVNTASDKEEPKKKIRFSLFGSWKKKPVHKKEKTSSAIIDSMESDNKYTDSADNNEAESASDSNSSVDPQDTKVKEEHPTKKKRIKFPTIKKDKKDKKGQAVATTRSEQYKEIDSIYGKGYTNQTLLTYDFPEDAVKLPPSMMERVAAIVVYSGATIAVALTLIYYI